MQKDTLLVGVGLKCEPEEFKEILLNLKVSFFNEQTRVMKYYYDEIVYFFFETDMSRQDISELFRSQTLMKMTFEFGFYDSID